MTNKVVDWTESKPISMCNVIWINVIPIPINVIIIVIARRDTALMADNYES